MIQLRLIYLSSLLFLGLLSTNIYAAKMPTLMGELVVNSESYRDTIYNYLINNSTRAINVKEIRTFDTIVASSSLYGIRFRVHFSNANMSFRTRAKNKVIQVRDDIRTVFMKIAVFFSSNNKTPGTCEPDIIGEWILK